jgi:hypothetical protein
VRTTYLRLYVPLTLAGFTVKPGRRGRGRFAAGGGAAQLRGRRNYERHSGFSTRPTPTGQFSPLPALDAKISIAQFTQLCRRLDIGGQYQRYLDNHLDLGNLWPAPAWNTG